MTTTTKPELIERLTRLQGRKTLYEIIIECTETGARYLMSYSDRWTRSSIVTDIRERVEAIRKVTGVADEAWERGNKVADPITGRDAQGHTWKIRKSGRTQRECYCEGELPWIVDVANGQ